MRYLVALTIFDDDECIHGLTLTTCVICKAPRRRQPAANRTSSYDNGRKTPENSHDYFGHPWPECFAMCDAGAAYIRERALNGELVTYGELWEATERQMGKPIDNPWRQVPNLLTHISDREYERTGALLVVPSDREVLGIGTRRLQPEPGATQHPRPDNWSGPRISRVGAAAPARPRSRLASRRRRCRTCHRPRNISERPPPEHLPRGAHQERPRRCHRPVHPHVAAAVASRLHLVLPIVTDIRPPGRGEEHNITARTTPQWASGWGAVPSRRCGPLRQRHLAPTDTIQLINSGPDPGTGQRVLQPVVEPPRGTTAQSEHANWNKLGRSFSTDWEEHVQG